MIKFNSKLILIFLLLLLMAVPMVFAETVTPTVNPSATVNIPQKSNQTIAFSSKRNGKSQIYTINEDGTDLKKLTNNDAENVKPSWSPDGTKILYQSIKGGKREIWVMGNDGSNPLRVATDSDVAFRPAWSPDGSKILFTIRKGIKSKILVVNSDGSKLTSITNGD